MQIKSSFAEYRNPICDSFVSWNPQTLQLLYGWQESAAFPFDLMVKLPENLKWHKTRQRSLEICWAMAHCGTFTKQRTDFTLIPWFFVAALYHTSSKPPQNFQSGNVINYSETKTKEKKSD